MNYTRGQREQILPGIVGEWARLLLPPVFLLGLVALILSLLNLVPAYFQEGRLQSYQTVREASRDLGIEILLPAYFPDYLSWPPTEILGHRIPYPAVDVSIRGRGEGVDVLWIHEEHSDAEYVAPKLDCSCVLVETTPVTIGQASGWHVVLKDLTGTYYQQVYWREGPILVSVTTTYSWGELERIAESMSFQH